MTESHAIQRTEPSPATVRRDETHEWTYRPDVDVLDLGDEVRMVADVPGAAREHIEVGFDDGVLTIQAAVRPRTPPGARWILQEYGVGGFHRRFVLDDTIDPEGITADYRNGTVTVRLPKRRGYQRRQIPVNS